jgi:hypothetical protein
MNKPSITFGDLPVGAIFMRNGMRWVKEPFPSGHNARYAGKDACYFSAEFKDFQDVTPVPRERLANKKT